MIRVANRLIASLTDPCWLCSQLNPVVGFWDPLNLSGGEFWGDSNAATIGFLREAEIKHGRVAMAAFVGYIVHANDIKFPWALAKDYTAPDGVAPQELWDTMPEAGKWQIILTVGFFEFWRACRASSIAPSQHTWGEGTGEGASLCTRHQTRPPR